MSQVEPFNALLLKQTKNKIGGGGKISQQGRKVTWSYSGGDLNLEKARQFFFFGLLAVNLHGCGTA